MSYFSPRRGDPWLALTVFGLVLFGILMIYSASIILAHTLYGDDQYFVKRQLVSAVIGFVILAITASVDYKLWERWAGWMLIATFVALISVFFFSSGNINGAHRWIELGGQSLQPSELAKLTFTIYAAAWLSRRNTMLDDIRQTFIPYVVVILAISVLMLREPDFGTLTIIVLPAIAIYFVAGLSWKQLGLGAVAIALSLSIILVSPYRRARLETFVNPTTNTGSQAYQVENVAIAIGSGGWKGLGFGQSKQKRLFLPEPHTDSIFAIISEELGSVRSSLLILAFCFLVYRGYRIALLTDDLFGRYVAIGITTWLGFQAFINFGSMLHMVPLVGVPLPFISYGGTSLLVSLAAIGMLLNISQHIRQTPAPGAIVRKSGRHG
jgi:cell division protein FtsW